MGLCVKKRTVDAAESAMHYLAMYDMIIGNLYGESRRRRLLVPKVSTNV
jgi:hypothetical protein